MSIPEHVLRGSIGIFTACFLVDFTLYFKAAIDLRNMLIRMEQVKKEMVRIHKRLDVMIALAGQGVENYKTALTESVSTVKEEFSESMAYG